MPMETWKFETSAVDSVTRGHTWTKAAFIYGDEYCLGGHQPCVTAHLAARACASSQKSDSRAAPTVVYGRAAPRPRSTTRAGAGGTRAPTAGSRRAALVAHCSGTRRPCCPLSARPASDTVPCCRRGQSLCQLSPRPAGVASRGLPQVLLRFHLLLHLTQRRPWSGPLVM